MITRYENAEITALWTPTAIYRRWWEVEVAALRELDPALADLAEEIGPPTQRAIAYHEQRCGHDVVAFLTAWDATIRENAVKDDPMTAQLRSRMHYGLTSSDIVDTALARGLLVSGQVLDNLAADVDDAFLAACDNTEGKRTVGRTHGQLAATMNAADRWRVLRGIVGRSWRRASDAFRGAEVGKLSGPVGSLFRDTEWSVLNELGLRPTLATQLVPRDYLAHLAHCLAEVATACEAVATQVWLFAQQGIEEVALYGPGVTTSSAMPHKRNPVICETVRGLARLARGNAEALQAGVVQWGEHDMSHSSVERVALPDLLHLVAACLDKVRETLLHVEWHEPTLPDHYRDTSAVLRSAQASGLAWADAHDAVRTGRLTDVVSSAATTAAINEGC